MNKMANHKKLQFANKNLGLISIEAELWPVLSYKMANLCCDGNRGWFYSGVSLHNVSKLADDETLSLPHTVLCKS